MSNLFRLTIAGDPEAIAKVREWIAALRSGEYHQAPGRLRALEIPDASTGSPGAPRDAFCCLGVACDLYAKQDPLIRWEKLVSLGDDSLAATYDCVVLCEAEPGRHEVEDRADGRLPYVVLDRLHIQGPYGTYDEDERSLAGDNDRGVGFERIADTIERELNLVLGA